ARLVAFFDCCHSGSIARFAVGKPPVPEGVKERYLKVGPELRQAHRAFRQGRGGATRFLARSGQEEMRHIQFSACQDHQTAKESGGHGWFSRVATELIQAAPGVITNLDFQKMLEEGFVRRRYRDQ